MAEDKSCARGARDAADAAVAVLSFAPRVENFAEATERRALLSSALCSLEASEQRVREVSAAVVEFATQLGGELKPVNKAILRASDAETTTELAIYRDDDAPVVYRVTWHSVNGTEKGPLKPLDSEFLFLVPPEPAPPADAAAEGGAA